MRLHGPSLSTRSEEHTSELQSQFHLVCRLLLEKKKKNLIVDLPGDIQTANYKHENTLLGHKPPASMVVLRVWKLYGVVLEPVACFFFFNDTATTEIYTLSLHDALPI